QTINMERLFFALVLIGTTLAFQPVPPPYRTAKAFDTAYVTIATNQTYDPSKVKQYMDQFPQTKIQQYSSQLGDFRHLRSADVDGHFGFDFAIWQCVCRLVEQWVNQIVRSSKYYTSGHTRCLREQESIEIQRTATKTTTTSSPIAPQPAPPPYRFGKGLDTTNVKIVTNQTFDISNVKQHMDYFPQTKIQQYANQLGDFSNLGYDDVNDNFAYTFTISHCVCAHVEQWVNQIVQSSQYYTSGNTRCFYEGKEFLREKIATTTPITTTTTTGSPIAFQPAPPPYGTGKGDDMTNVKIVTNQPYRKSDIKQYMRYFDQTKIYQYSSKLGDFSSLRYADVDGYTAFTFTMSNCICGYMEQWLNQIVQSSQYYTGGSTRCFYKGFVRERTANKTTTTTTTTMTTTTTTASSPIALQPVPPPPFHGRGRDTAQVTLVTNQPYDPSKVKQHMNYFPQTKIQQYANELGDFSNLGYAVVNDNFAYTFAISRSACEYVNLWVSRIVRSSSYYTIGNTTGCAYEGSPFVREKIAAATTATIASSPILSPSDISNLLNMPECEKD
ncbi:hypothetical protein V3C99_000097, partial [Haemonchus contortus]